MNNRNAIVALALLAVAIGCIVVVAVRWQAGKAPVGMERNAINATPAPAVAAAGDDVATARTATPDAEAPPPWMQSDADVPPAKAGDTGNSRREQQLRRLDESVRGIVAASRMGAAERNQHMREALSALDELDDPAVKAQLDLDALRRNFEISVRMQALATQLQDVAARPRSPERQARIHAISTEMESLQAQMDPDVRAAGSTLPPIGAVPGAAARR